MRSSLTRALEDAGLGRVSRLRRLAAGWESTIWSCTVDGRRLAVRVFAPGRSPDVARKEAEAMRLAASLGFPVPRVHHVGEQVGTEGGAYLVMDLIDGEPLWDTGLTPTDVGTINGELMGWLHTVNLPDTHESDPVSMFIDYAASAVQRTPGLAPIVDWVVTHQGEPGRVVAVHGDLHPGNILLDRERQPWVIDWTAFMVAPALLDVTWTRLLGEMHAEKGFVGAFIRAYEQSSRLPSGDAVFEVISAIRRVVDYLHFTSEEGAGQVQASAGIREHLPRLAVPAAWIERQTGYRIPELDGLLSRG